MVRTRAWALCGVAGLVVATAGCANTAHVTQDFRVGPATSTRLVRSVRSTKDVHGTAQIPFGSARYFGGVRPAQLGTGIIGIAASSNGRGYWIATANGNVFCFGDAGSYGSRAAPTGHIAAIVATGRGGYWLATSTGVVFSFGDAPSHGGAAISALSTPVVAMAATPMGHGSWLAASGGRVFAYGNARAYGSATPALCDHVVAMAATPDGRGYWLADSGGRVFSFGDARFHGSPLPSSGTTTLWRWQPRGTGGDTGSQIPAVGCSPSVTLALSVLHFQQ